MIAPTERPRLSDTDVAVLNVLMRGGPDWVAAITIGQVVWPRLHCRLQDWNARYHVRTLRSKGLPVEGLFGYGYRYVRRLEVA